MGPTVERVAAVAPRAGSPQRRLAVVRHIAAPLVGTHGWKRRQENLIAEILSDLREFYSM